MAPTTTNGIANMNKILGLKARPNESFTAAFQPGQANAAVELKRATASNSVIANLLLGIASIIVFAPYSYPYSYF